MESNNYKDLDDYIYNKCSDAFNCDEYIENHIKITYDKLAVFNSLDLLAADNLHTFLNSIFQIFLEAIETLPEEKKPLHALSNTENPEQMIVYLKSNNNWECIKMDDNLTISKRFTQLVMKPMLIECIRVWTISLPTIQSQEDLQQYLICGVALNKYLVTMEKMKDTTDLP